MNTKIFYQTDDFDFWSNPILKDEKCITYLLVDGCPHTITDEGEPLYPIKNYKLVGFEEYIKSLSIDNIIKYNYQLKENLALALKEIQHRSSKVKSKSQKEKYIRAEMKLFRNNRAII